MLISKGKRLRGAQIDNATDSRALEGIALFRTIFFFWFLVLFLIAYLRRHMGCPKEHSFQSTSRVKIHGEGWLAIYIQKFNQIAAKIDELGQKKPS